MPFASKTSNPHEHVEDAKDREQLHKDRMHALIFLAVLAAIFVLLAWLATMGNPPEGVDYGNWMIP